MRPLTNAQERRLREYVEEQFFEISREFKKRSDPSSSLQTLPEYLRAAHKLLNVILQTPPIDPSASLRVILLLRLSGDIFSAIQGYPPASSSLKPILDWLEDLDRGWQAVMRRQSWDAQTMRGTDVDLAPVAVGTTPFTSTPMSQTECTRLRSLLITGASDLEEWVERIDRAEGTDFEDMLEQLGVRRGFEELFFRTLGELGASTSSTGSEQSRSDSSPADDLSRFSLRLSSDADESDMEE